MVSRVCLLVIVGLLGRGAWLGWTLPERLDTITARAEADGGPLVRSLRRCTAGSAPTVARARRCELPWPASRSVLQQEAMFDARLRMGLAALLIDTPDQLDAAPADHIVLAHRGTAALYAVPAGEQVTVAGRVLASVRPKVLTWHPTETTD